MRPDCHLVYGGSGADSADLRYKRVVREARSGFSQWPGHGRTPPGGPRQRCKQCPAGASPGRTWPLKALPSRQDASNTLQRAHIRHTACHAASSRC